MVQNSQETDLSLRLPPLEIPTTPEGVNTSGDTNNRDRLQRYLNASE